MIKGFACYIIYVLVSLSAMFLLTYCVNQYQEKQDKEQYKHDSYIYELGYISGWNAKENGDIFDPEYYE